MKKRLISSALSLAMLVTSLGVPMMQSVASAATGAADFSDDFSAYTAETAQTEKYSLTDGKKTLAQSGEFTWETSGVWVGNSVSSPTADRGFAYIDAENDKLRVLGRWGSAVGESRYAQVNLNSDNVNIGNIDRVIATTSYNNTRYAGLRLFVSADEKSYYEFGIKDNQKIGNAQNGDIADGLEHYQPFIRMGTGTNNLTTVLKVGDEGTSASTTEWTSGDREVTWDITIDNDTKKINFTCTSSAGNTWTGSFSDTAGLSGSLWKYPVAFASTGDGEVGPASLNSIDMWYTPGPDYSDDFTSYTELNSKTEKYLLTDGSAVIAQKGNYAWKSSSVWMGNDSNSPTANKGFTYVDAAEDRMYLQGRWASNVKGDRYAAVNLDNTYPFESLERVKVTLSRNGTRFAGIRLLINESENAYYEFGMKDDSGAIGIEQRGGDDYPDGVEAFKPFVRVATSQNYNKMTNILQAGAEGTTSSGADWGADDKKVIWDITIDKANGIISFTCKSTNSDAVWQGSFEDTYGLINTQWRYPVAFTATGDGEANPAYIENLNMWCSVDEEYVAPDFAENFASYTADNAVTEKYNLIDGKKTLAGQGNASWETSAVWVGNSAENPTNGKGFAYIDTGADTLYLQGRWGDAVQPSRYAAVNLKIDDIKIDNIDKIRAVTGRNGTRFAGLHLFVSKDEKTYYEFGIKNNERIGYKQQGGDENPDNLVSYQPFIRMANGKTYDELTTILQVGSEGTASTGTDWGQSDSEVIWEISVNKETKIINFTCSSTSSDAVWQGSFVDEYGIVDSDWKYPISFSVTGDGEAKPGYLKSLDMWYTEDTDYVAPDFAQDFTEFKSYTGENLKLKELAESGNVTIAETDSGVKFNTSKINYGSDYGRVQITPGRMYLLGRGGTINSLVNISYDDTDTYFDTLKRVKFTASRGSTRMGGMRLFVSGNEKNAFEFGIKNNEEILDDKKEGYMELPHYTPYVAKVIDGTIYVVDYITPEEGAWEKADNEVTYDISVEGNTVTWTAKTTTGKVWQGSYTDTDGIISANWRYPASFVSRGDAGEDVLKAASFTDVNLWYTTRELSYPDGQPTEEELLTLYKGLSYSGRPSEIYALLGHSFDKLENTSASVTVDPARTYEMSNKLLSVQCEFSDNYDSFFDADGNILPEVREYLDGSAPVKSWRWGGGTVNSVNLLNTITPYGGGERSQSVYLDDVYLPVAIQNKIKAKAQELVDGGMSASEAAVQARVANEPYRMGVTEYIKLQHLVNPTSSFAPCVSLYTMTPEDVVEFLRYMTSTQTKYVNWRKANGLSGEALIIDFVELGNEIEWGDNIGESTIADQLAWYTTRANEYIDAIHEFNPAIKVALCGPTAPWGEGGSQRTIEWTTGLANGIGNKAYAIAFHPYYYGHGVSLLMDDYAASIKTTYDEIAGTDIKIIATEHARNWNSLNNPDIDRDTERVLTSSMYADASTALFLFNVADKDWVDSAYYHNWFSNTYLWMFFSKINGEWIESGMDKTYNTLNKVLGGKGVAVSASLTPEIDGSVNALQNDVDFIASKTGSRQVQIAMVNRNGYRDVDVSFDIAGEYLLAEETVYTAPNILTFAYDNTAADLMSVTTTKHSGEAALTSYCLPRNSIVVLTLVNNDGNSEIREEFTSDVLDFTVSELDVLMQKTQEIGNTGWEVIHTKAGEYIVGSEYKYGEAKISGGKLMLTTAANATEFAANWNAADILSGVDKLKSISFKTTDTAGIGGVKLFADDNADSIYDFNNSLSGLSGTVDWTVIIGEASLDWTASNGAAIKSGSMAYTEAPYKYLMSLYAQGAGNISLSGISILFTEAQVQGLTVVDGTTVDVTVNPAAYTAEEGITVITAFYNGNKLISADVKNTSGTAETFHITKPDGYTGFKVMLWDKANDMKPVTGVYSK